MSLPVYSRAQLSRTVALVVALSLTAVSTGAFARDFRAAETRNEDYQNGSALRRAPDGFVAPLNRNVLEQPYGQDLSGLATKLGDGAKSTWPHRGRAAARLIERLRKVE